MNGYVEDIESILDEFESDEWEERARPGRGRPVRTPSRRSSFSRKASPSAASQGQVQAAARNLDQKIETLSTAVKTLETRTNTIAADQTKLGTGLKSTRGDLQQTKTLAAVLPLIATNTANWTDPATGSTVKVVTQPQNQFTTLLPLLLLMGGGSTDGAKGPFGDTSTFLLLAVLLSQKQ